MKKIKVIIFDIDGVLIKTQHYFSHELEQKGYKNAEKIIASFWKKEVDNKHDRGKGNEKKTILPYLKKIGWEKSVQQFFQEHFEFNAKFLNKNLISLIKKLQKDKKKCYLGTDQMKTRAKFLLDEMGFKKIFDGYFISCHVGHRKIHDNFWIHVLKKLNKDLGNIKPEEIVFFDDAQKNIDVAKKFGINAFLFKDITQFKKDLKKLN